ncbi:hypothetical protein GLOIN_2v1719803 [Rhizophagus irregularis DAOM 181602=DAOM 197198]|uniref:Uncharacterized protein n=1 Tax=Rhizophagus irregularis (strain DAOM 181602 / DAOM 197198 / MUCL 43194) TaxID=747089 RepID=A0A2P4P2X0_RHIID|nr:hypothetical protein GLOIN_2v1719803 [Rhizophagus irregularis DAOM 181602=DAOM 197198]POG59736.1 hypothetical protein GLOIN_2v1719803 [Rhizophagus irregularis DAOM 181602=DAOM 197198]GET56330.1 hypothetical protein GLOIN_2v1719803 [Rhizophagus irregularis DAOM 181602=DAOM 197198]|eukprot:XP_025166602.1 hypothetical protein GLOIN_2v1719803 [Rhizophagus irregularis DAOM 181602=DAOM 197198]
MDSYSVLVIYGWLFSICSNILYMDVFVVFSVFVVLVIYGWSCIFYFILIILFSFCEIFFFHLLKNRLGRNQ